MAAGKSDHLHAVGSFFDHLTNAFATPVRVRVDETRLADNIHPFGSDNQVPLAAGAALVADILTGNLLGALQSSKRK